MIFFFVFLNGKEVYESICEVVDLDYVEIYFVVSLVQWCFMGQVNVGSNDVVQVIKVNLES